MKYKLVIFDFDGTLADSFPWFLQVINTVADRYRFNRVEPSEVGTLRGYSARRILQHLGVPRWKLPLIARYARQLAARDRNGIALFAGVDRMLQALSEAGITLAVVSSNSEDTVRHVLGPANAARITHYECGTAMFGKRARFQRILRRSGVRPRQALCVGDEIRDVEAATAAGTPFGAVGWGYTHIDALTAHTPAEVFLRMEDIMERLT